MYCPVCEHHLEEGMRFCPYCGYELSGRQKKRSFLKMLLIGIGAAALVAALIFVSTQLFMMYKNNAVKPAQEVSALSIKPENYLDCIYPNEPVKLLTEVWPEGAQIGTVRWSSSDESIATVDATGNVRFLCVGSAVITATLENGVSAETSLTSSVRPYRLTFAEKTSILEIGSSLILSPIIAPADAKYSQIEWRSSDEKIVKVERDGRITGVSEGRAIITATVAGDIVGKTNVFVYRYLFDILMNFVYENGTYDEEFDEYFILLDYAETRMTDGKVINKRTYISLYPDSDYLILYCDVYTDEGEIYYETLVYFSRIKTRSARVQFYCDCDDYVSSHMGDIPMSVIGSRLEVNAKGTIDPQTYTYDTTVEFDTYEGDEGFRGAAEQITNELIAFSMRKLVENWESFGLGYSIGEVLGLVKVG